MKPGVAGTGTAGNTTGTSVVVGGRNAVEAVLSEVVLSVGSVVVVVEGKQPGLAAPPHVDSDAESELTPALSWDAADDEADELWDAMDDWTDARAGPADKASAAAASAATRIGERMNRLLVGNFPDKGNRSTHSCASC